MQICNKERNLFQIMYGYVVDDIRFLSSSIFCSFLHVKRKGNRLTYALARQAVSSADTDVWLEDLPPNLNDVFQFDFP